MNGSEIYKIGEAYSNRRNTHIDGEVDRRGRETGEKRYICRREKHVDMRNRHFSNTG